MANDSNILQIACVQKFQINEKLVSEDEKSQVISIDCHLAKGDFIE